MPLHPSWQDIGLRLALTVLASGLIGFDRGVRGHAAGLRTTLLVGLAAAMAMIQANLLLPVDGKTSGSFGVMDLMRMPLGILTGVGFIGGGAILKRGDIVSGLTTAATLWLTTVIGLCFGGGQNLLGAAGTGLALATLFALKRVETVMPRERRARVVVRTDWGCSPAALPEQVAPLRATAHLQGQAEEAGREQMRLSYELSWRCSDTAGPPLEILAQIDRRFELVSFDMITAPPS
jgi:putative Mg2+ transporter-C (MgtC) family protein